jgi:hypothetical protein
MAHWGVVKPCFLMPASQYARFPLQVFKSLAAALLNISPVNSAAIAPNRIVPTSELFLRERHPSRAGKLNRH